MDPDYELFAAVVANGSIAAGGRALGISTPMASKRMARLETRLGARLINRTTRRLALTEVGRRFHDDVLDILAAIARAEAVITGNQDRLRGPLRMAAPTSFGRLHIAPHLKPFLDRYPEIELKIDLADQFIDLLAERIDLAIRITSEIGSDVVAHRLAANRRILCASRVYLAEHGIPTTLAQLSRHRLLAATGQMPWRLRGPGGPVTLAATSFIETNSSEVVRELAIAGAGIALRSIWDIVHELRSGQLVRLLPDHEGSADASIYAVHHRNALVSAGTRAMVQHLAGVYSAWTFEDMAVAGEPPHL